MRCSKCKNKATVETPFGERHYCDRHFLESIEKRIRKELRINQKLNVKKQYTLLNDSSSEYYLTKHFLKQIFNDNLKLKESKSKGDILPGSLDSETSKFLDSFLKNKVEKKTNHIIPLKVVSQNEIKELCRILKIKFVSKEQNEIADELEKNYPGTKFSLLKSAEFLKEN